MVKFMVCTSFILIISVDVDISAMPDTLYPRMQEESILENNLLRIGEYLILQRPNEPGTN